MQRTTKNPDFTTLQNDVMDKWENDAVEYFTHELVSNDPVHYENIVKPDYQAILDNPMACIAELGFEKMSDYLRESNTGLQMKFTGLIGDKTIKASGGSGGLEWPANFPFPEPDFSWMNIRKTVKPGDKISVDLDGGKITDVHVEPAVGIRMGYVRISKLRTKFFFEKDGQALEFCIDRDPENQTADLWIRPGETEAGLKFVIALLNELERAKDAE